jgi:hypothetical protein
MAELEIEAELRALGRTLLLEPPAEDLVERVLARLPVARPSRLQRVLGRLPTFWSDRLERAWRWLTRSRRRLVAVIIAALIIGLGLTPPVRAAVLHWLRIGGVVVKTEPRSSGVSPTPQPPPTVGPARTVAEAQRLVQFPIGVPAVLGTPDRVAVTDDRRIVSMDWGTGARQVHLEQFDGRFGWAYVKQDPGDIQVVAVNGRDGVWFPTAHRIVYVDSDGREHSEQPRISAPSLVWERVASGRDVTLRVEGRMSRERALEIARSVG